jgi:hypothetical protein
MGTNPGFTLLAVKDHKEEDDVYDYGYALRNSLKRLDESEILSEGDKEFIREFLEHLRAKRVSTGRLAKYGFTIRRLTEDLPPDIGRLKESLRVDPEPLPRPSVRLALLLHYLVCDFCFSGNDEPLGGAHAHGQRALARLSPSITT